MHLYEFAIILYNTIMFIIYKTEEEMIIHPRQYTRYLAR